MVKTIMLDTHGASIAPCLCIAEVLGQQYELSVFLSLGTIIAECHPVICREFAHPSDSPFCSLKLAAVYVRDKETTDR